MIVKFGRKYRGKRLFPRRRNSWKFLQAWPWQKRREGRLFSTNREVRKGKRVETTDASQVHRRGPCQISTERYDKTNLSGAKISLEILYNPRVENLSRVVSDLITNRTNREVISQRRPRRRIAKRRKVKKNKNWRKLTKETRYTRVPGTTRRFNRRLSHRDHFAGWCYLEITSRYENNTQKCLQRKKFDWHVV